MTNAGLLTLLKETVLVIRNRLDAEGDEASDQSCEYSDLQADDPSGEIFADGEPGLSAYLLLLPQLVLADVVIEALRVKTFVSELEQSRIRLERTSYLEIGRDDLPRLNVGIGASGDAS